jgi:hypothetical protein
MKQEWHIDADGDHLLIYRDGKPSFRKPVRLEVLRGILFAVEHHGESLTISPTACGALRDEIKRLGIGERT